MLDAAWLEVSGESGSKAAEYNSICRPPPPACSNLLTLLALAIPPDNPGLVGQLVVHIHRVHHHWLDLIRLLVPLQVGDLHLNWVGGCVEI